MRFDTNSATPKLTFKPVRVLEPHEHNQAIEQGKTNAAKRAITMTVAEADGVKVAAPIPVTINLQSKTVEVDTEAVEEPVKRTAKKEEAPAEKKDLSKILDEWDD
jgi:hypothetical protein